MKWASFLFYAISLSNLFIGWYCDSPILTLATFIWLVPDYFYRRQEAQQQLLIAMFSAETWKEDYQRTHGPQWPPANWDEWRAYALVRSKEIKNA